MVFHGNPGFHPTELDVLTPLLTTITLETNRNQQFLRIYRPQKIMEIQTFYK